MFFPRPNHRRRDRNLSARPISSKPALQLLESRDLLSALINLEGSTSLQSYAGVGFQMNEVATMTGYENNVLDPTPGDFSVQINWGDGNSSSGVLAVNNGGSGGEFQVKGPHVYNQTGTFQIRVTATGLGTSVDQETTRSVVSYMPSGIPGISPTTGSPSLSPCNVVTLLEGSTSLSSYAAVGFQENEVATLGGYLNGQTDTQIHDFKAWINWGDSNQWFQADLAPNTGGSGFDFQAKGNHIYQQVGTYHVVVYAVGPDGTSLSTQTNQVQVSNTPSGIPGIAPTTGNPSILPSNVVTLLEGSTSLSSYAAVGFQENEVATLGGYLNGQTDSQIHDFKAWINWGDSNQWFQADLAPNTGGSGYDFQAKGNHIYQQVGTYHVVVYAVGPDGTSLSTQTSQVQVAKMPSGIPGTAPATGTPSMSAGNVGMLLEGSNSLSSYAGIGFQGIEVATEGGYLNGQTDTLIKDFSAWINWGDSNQWYQAALVSNAGGSGFDFQVVGGHTYQQVGTYPIVVYAVGPDGTSVTQLTSQSRVAANPNPVSPPPTSPPPVSPPPVSPPPASPPPASPPPTSPPPARSTPDLVGYKQFAVGLDTGSGVVQVYNSDQSLRFTVSPFGAGFTGGVRVASADFNGDGIADIAVGTGPGGPSHVEIIDGMTQQVLFAIDPFEASFTGGVFVAVGDLNGDGTPDLVISPDQGGGPRVRIFDGRTLNQIADFFAIDDPNFRGGTRAAIGDIAGRGYGDLVVAAGFGGGPRIATFDGMSLSTGNPVKLFGDFFAFESSLSNGTYVAVGDINGDGHADIITGGGPGGGPRVSVFNGAQLLAGNQSRFVDFFAGDSNNRGGVRVAIKDLANDGYADLVVGSGIGAGSRVTAYLGKDLTAGTPAPDLNFDAFPGFNGGVYVG